MTPVPGVQLADPPPSLRGSVDAEVLRIAGDLPLEAHGAVVGVLHRAVSGQPVMNLAIVHRTDTGWQVGAYVGKTWGEPVAYGASIRKTW